MADNTVVAKTQRLTKQEFAQVCVDCGDGTCAVLTEDGGRFIVDKVDAAKAMALRWYSRPQEHTVRYMAHSPDADAPVQIGRLIANTPPALYCDHVDGDASNNRRSNLRNCTPAQNCANAHLRASKGLRYKGVYEYRPGRFRAMGTSNGSLRHLGVWGNPADAALAYDDFARREFGAFARLNFPRSGEQPAIREAR